MVDNKHVIFGIHVRNRVKNAASVQDLFTEYGCYIKTRLGLHEVAGEYCSPTGLILLEMFGDAGKVAELKAKIAAVEGLELQEMVFGHDA